MELHDQATPVEIVAVIVRSLLNEGLLQQVAVEAEPSAMRGEVAVENVRGLDLHQAEREFRLSLRGRAGGALNARVCRIRGGEDGARPARPGSPRARSARAARIAKKR